MSGYCFVIQPFDAGKFDRRYSEVFSPAIRDAGLDPYRVDQDPSVSIPIQQIEEGIQNARCCLADITVDNPNVWFEVGYALAANKELCLVCASSRTDKYPFDVQHRKIIKYDAESPSDFQTLRARITESLDATLKRVEHLATLESKLPMKEDAGLSQHEVMVLASIMEGIDGPTSSLSHWYLKNALEGQGYNNLGLNVGLARLLRKGFISEHTESDPNGDLYKAYSIETDGQDWLLQNLQQLDLTAKPKRKQRSSASSLDDDIPF